MADPDRRDGTHGRAPVGSGEADLQARLTSLGSQLDRKRGTAPAQEVSGRSTSNASAMARAFRISSEFIAGVIAGGGLGWLIDYGLGTSPWGLIVFLMLGFAAGVFNVVRSAGPSGGALGEGVGPG